MKCKDKYVQRVSDKYNRRHVTAFVRKGAENRYLKPLGLSLRSLPPEDFGEAKERLSREEEFQLFTALHFMKYKLQQTRTQQYLDIYIALRNRALSANWSLVPKCIEKSRFSSTDTALFMEKGTESLISSVDCFDPWLGFRFSTYACTAIYKSFLFKPKKNVISSLNGKIYDLSEEQEDDNTQLWLERLEDIMQRRVLTVREKDVLMYRFGCFGHEIDNRRGKLTLKEVAVILDITKERVRQIQVEALSKLKEELHDDLVLH